MDFSDFNPTGKVGLKRGRKAANLHIGEARELTLAEAQFASETTTQTIEPLKKLTDRHHTLAKLLANGTGTTAAATIVGMQPSRVSVLKNDPAFKELVTFYKQTADAEYVDMHAQLAGMSQDALLAIREKLEDSPEDFSVGQLLELMKAGADRSGHGPSSTTNTNVNVNLATRLADARKRAGAALKEALPPVIEGEVING